MSTLKKYLTGKSVALVGPASTLRGRQMGSLIDAHDVVVRINHAWPLPKKMRGDIGSRVDIVYHNLNPRRQRIRKIDVKRMRRDGVKWIISSHPEVYARHRRRIRRVRKLSRGILKVVAVPRSVKKRLRPVVGGANTGLVAIVDLLRYRIKHLYVTGFSFYSTDYLPYPNYKKSFIKKALRRHNQNKHKTYLAQLLRREKRLRVDLAIRELLENHLDQKSLNGRGSSGE